MAINNQTIKDFLHLLADEADRVHKKFWRQLDGADYKGDQSPVTIADKTTEKSLRDLINRHYPDHGILGEEWGNENLDQDYVWVIDPIDGTKGFMVGGPIFTCLIALCHRGVPIAGVINQPILKERIIGIQDEATTFNNKEIKLREWGGFDGAIGFFSASDLEDFFNDREKKVINTLRKKCAVERSCYDSYAYGLMAMGYVDIICESQMAPYDYMALVPIITGAGGVITDWQGEPLTLKTGTGSVLAGGAKLHQQSLSIIANL